MPRNLLLTVAALFVLSLAGCPRPAEEGPPEPGPAPPGQSGEGVSGQTDAGGPAAAAPEAAGAEGREGGSDLPYFAYMTENTFAAVVIHPQKVAASPLLEPIVTDERMMEQLGQLPVDPRKLEELAVLFAEPAPGGGGPGGLPAPTAVGRFPEEVDPQAVLDEMWGEMLKFFGGKIEERTYQGKTYYSPGGPMPMVAYWPDNRTLVLTEEAALQKILDAQKANGPLAARLRKIGGEHDLVAVVALEPVRDLVAQAADQAGPEMPDLDQLVAASGELDAISIVADLGGDPVAKVALEAVDAEKATGIEELVLSGQELGRTFLANLGDAAPPEAEGMAGPGLKLAGEALEAVGVVRDGKTVTVTLARPASLDEVVPELLAQAKQAAQKAAGQAQRMNNLKQVALSMHIYHSIHESFPPAAIRDADGKPLLSWRVAILPMIEQQTLYDQFDLEKPWDSPENAKLIAEMPEVYLSAGRENDGKTTLFVFTGESALFGGEAAPKIPDIRDGTANTIMVVEAGLDKAVEWTKPEDLTFDPNDPIGTLGEISGDAFPAALCDGSVRMIDTSVDPEALRRLIQHADGQPIGPGALE